MVTATAMSERTPVSLIEASTMRKVFARLMPLVILAGAVQQLDRANIGFAALTINKDLGLTPYTFGLAAGIFAIGYVLFEIPSNLILFRVGSNIWFARIMLTWGLICMALGFVHNAQGLYIGRFLLGFAEAGLNPGMTFYAVLWTPLRYRARFIALFVLAVPIAGILGGPLATVIMQANGVLGFAGWQWIFIIEGLFAVLLAYPAFKLLTPSPEKAGWLQDDQRSWLTQELTAERALVEGLTGQSSAMNGLTNPRVYAIGLLYVGVVMGIYGTSIWLPTIVKSLGPLSIWQVSLLISLIWACAGVSSYFWGRRADQTGAHYANLAIPLFVGGIGFMISAFVGFSPVLSIIFFTVAAAGILGALTVFWVVPGLFLNGIAIASAMALINTFGNTGGFLGPYIVGWIKEVTGSFQNALIVLSCALLSAGIIALVIRPRVQHA